MSIGSIAACVPVDADGSVFASPNGWPKDNSKAFAHAGITCPVTKIDIRLTHK